MSLFKINTTDISDRIESGSYNVNENDVYNTWTDANGIVHRDILRTRVSGTFNVLFRTKDEYENFVELIKNNKVTAGYVPNCSVVTNNTNKTINGNYYIEYSPIRSMAMNGVHQMDMFTVTITERNRND